MTLVKKVGLLFIVFSLICTPLLVGAETQVEEKARLEAELRQLEAEIKEKEAILAKQRQQTGSIQRDVSILTNEIAKARKNIQAKTLVINNLGKEINAKSQKIEVLTDKMEAQRESLGQLIRKTDELDRVSIAQILFTGEKISDIYGDVDSYSTLQQELNNRVNEIKEVKEVTEVEKSSLEKKKDAELDAKVELESSKKKVELSQKEKDALLRASKNKEKEYETILAERQARAATIRATLFPLRDAGEIKFGEALELAKMAQNKTGVRPAFLLAIITQESALGKNVGTCYMTDPSTGDGERTNGTKISGVMKLSRDVTPFMRITKELGRDYARTRVSCPLSYGYGGGMGPAQFIPSTWEYMEAKIGRALGVSTPDPWNPGHAFMASALYLADLGADAATYSAERNAACRYYSGRSCAGNKNGTTYGNQVMSKATKIQEEMIDPLTF